MTVAIRAEDLSKKYVLSHRRRQPYTSLRDVITERVTRPFRKHAEPAREEFWALDGVSFDIQRGDRMGIIGRNGAGKSTLLKIVSRITEPTRGWVGLNGRVASLLEVGTGFHPELTGRENVFINGSILGMSRAEVRRRFDEIVAFAEVEKFLDTPVKQFSSGMRVRLAFAVAAHLDSEILIVDEVLAVGDAQFQQKCLGRMGEISRSEGRTVLFVSHNMAAIDALCDRVLLLTSGKVARVGVSGEVISHYLTLMSNAARESLAAHATSNIKAVALQNRDGIETTTFAAGDDILFDIDLFHADYIDTPRVSIGIHTMAGERLVTIHTDIQNNRTWGFQGEKRIRAVWHGNRLVPGTYRVDVSLWGSDAEIETLPGCVELEIVPADIYGTAALPDPSFQGYYLADAHWEL